MEEIKENPIYPDMKAEIEAMLEVDQESIKADKWNLEAAKKRTERLKEIIEKIGLPTISKVGEEGHGAAFFIVQHSDFDVEFQKRYLEMMKSAPSEEVNKRYTAFLEDRTRVNTGRLQVYGTQFYKNEKGVWGPRPMIDPKNIETRRKEVGLEPFLLYKQLWDKPPDEKH
ncbi:MAG: hypothetical protein UV20_C0012G0020 [Candidatus Magasanikbacteria bacterium GW2011_GWA2_42_32]|uniref:Uncharacterized protein n=1 Tax=Candidatus Magasanikbacteria bacterium GW2011_GWA2_42_32 TaxID=1619039 RepID=A0A0G1A688_9BACT|nr:MAG: hypothetical protein UV20_C0012G0020 [Candidatus Magasanikbacteria bacterium GW2011_GWA2_42_32]HBL52402.1 hypothetical protein [Candidatus Blackburnbacteria bacterium]